MRSGYAPGDFCRTNHSCRLGRGTRPNTPPMLIVWFRASTQPTGLAKPDEDAVHRAYYQYAPSPTVKFTKTFPRVNPITTTFDFRLSKIKSC